MLFSLLLFAVSAHAYIPGSHFIFDRLTSQHGKGAYVIEQEVLFRDGVDSAVVKENWLVADGGEMRVAAQGGGLKIFKLLKKKHLYWNDSGSERADVQSDDYFMTALLTRNAAEEKRFFIRWGILPEDVLREKKPVKEVKQIRNETESFTYLARIGGAPCYAYGQPSPVQGSPLPGAWIEQDEFVLRKMRSPSGAEFTGNDYVPYSKNLWYPRLQTVSFENHMVTVRVTSVASVELTSDRKNQLDPSRFHAGRSESVTSWPKSNLAGQIQEFYKRFR